MLSEVTRVKDLIKMQTVNGQLSRESLVKIKQSLDKLRDATAGGWAGKQLLQAGALDPVVALKAEAQEHMANALRKIMHADEPELGKLYAEFTTWMSTKNAMSPTTLEKMLPENASPWQMLWHSRYLAWAGGLGYAHGGSAQAAEAVGAMFAVTKLMQSTAWRTTSAATKDALATALASGKYEWVAEQATKLLIRLPTMGGAAPPPTGTSTVGNFLMQYGPNLGSAAPTLGKVVSAYNWMGNQLIQREMNQ
jgi:hypothetical protein